MSDFMQSYKVIIQLIDHLSELIMQKIHNNNHEDIAALLSQQHEALAKLVSLPATDEDKQILLDYLRDLQKRDANAMLVVAKEHSIIEKTLQNLVKIKKYFA